MSCVVLLYTYRAHTHAYSAAPHVLPQLPPTFTTCTAAARQGSLVRRHFDAHLCRETPRVLVGQVSDITAGINANGTAVTAANAETDYQPNLR